MAQYKGLVVVRRLEVLQRLEDLHSAMNNGVMHRPKSTRRKEKRFYRVNRREAANLPFFWIFSNDPWNLLHSA
jgi:hypothetical protein